MYSFENAIRLVIPLGLLCSAPVALGVQDRPGHTSGGLLVGEGLPPAELAKVIERANAQQARLEQVQASFHVTQFINVERLPKQAIDAWPELASTDGRIDGSIRWTRDQMRERVDISYVAPSGFIRHTSGQFLARTIVNEQDRQVICFPRSKQVIITKRTPLQARPVPADWLLPGTRESFSTLLALGSTFEGFRTADDGFVLRFTRPLGGGHAVSYEAKIEPSLDFAVVEWRSLDDPISTTISYRRTPEGVVVPTNAECVGTDGWRATLVIEELSLEKPEPESITFRFEPGMIIGDSTKDASKPEVLEVDREGTPVRVVGAIPPYHPASGVTKTVAGVAVAGLVLAVVLLRIRWA